MKYPWQVLSTCYSFTSLLCSYYLSLSPNSCLTHTHYLFFFLFFLCGGSQFCEIDTWRHVQYSWQAFFLLFICKSTTLIIIWADLQIANYIDKMYWYHLKSRISQVKFVPYTGSWPLRICMQICTQRCGICIFYMMHHFEAMSQYNIITEGIVQRLPFNIMAYLIMWGWVSCSWYIKVHFIVYVSV